MKTRLAATFFAILATLMTFVAWNSTKTYSVNTYLQRSITTFNSPEELFVFVGIGTSVIQEGHVAHWLRVSSGNPPLVEKISEELLVFHYRDGKLEKSKIDGVGSAGSPFAFRGEIYWGRGRGRHEVGPHHWRWNGTKFVGLTDQEWSQKDRQISSEFKLYSQMNAKEGWDEACLVLYGRETELRITMRSEEWRLITKVEPRAGNQTRVAIMLRSNSGGIPEVLIDHSEGYKQISADEYRRLKTSPTHE